MAYSPPSNKVHFNHTLSESTRNEEVEIRHSTIHEGNGAICLKAVERGHKFGPFQGVLKETAVDKSCAWEVSFVSSKFAYLYSYKLKYATFR